MNGTLGVIPLPRIISNLYNLATLENGKVTNGYLIPDNTRG